MGDWPVRRLTDPRAIRALAHPVRLDLLELLTQEGPLTATQCGDALGLTPASCSFHLRQLAKYGFVVEAEGGTGRQRPWRAVPEGRTWGQGPDVSPDERAAGEVASRVFLERHIRHLEDYLAAADDVEPEWQDAAVSFSLFTYLTPAELKELGEGFGRLIMPYLERLEDRAARPAGASKVHMFLYGFPDASGVEPPDA